METSFPWHAQTQYFDGTSLGNPESLSIKEMENDAIGNLIFGLARWIELDTDMEAEAKAPLCGLQICKDKGLSYFLIEIYLESLGQMVYGVTQILFVGSRIQHVFQQANKVEDSLANS
ncbi:hypothetical protein ACH5RR_000996 [Cinchona calisaya]|uniref:RNase H type-1 domain-containing protein n=1 Tax=Cinchona calisaya TaxID=153742 RepID=A0ABD3B266_9GENT